VFVCTRPERNRGKGKRQVFSIKEIESIQRKVRQMEGKENLKRGEIPAGVRARTHTKKG